MLVTDNETDEVALFGRGRNPNRVEAAAMARKCSTNLVAATSS
jgi:hypothetical protein